MQGKPFQPDGVTYAETQKHETTWHFEEIRTAHAAAKTHRVGLGFDRHRDQGVWSRTGRDCEGRAFFEWYI